MFETAFAVLIVLACGVMLLRLTLSERRRARFDAASRRTWQRSAQQAQRLWHWRSSHADARRVADEALRRARDGVHRDGNVIRPASFRPPRKPH
ncbi:MAG: hypothetical protein ABIX46_09035 [Burkholderiaceae bacterium]